MIIVQDTETGGGPGTLTPTFTGTDTGCIVGVVTVGGGTAVTATCNGIDMTLAKESHFANTNVYVYYLAGVATGNKNVIMSNAVGWSSSLWKAYAVSGMRNNPAEAISGTADGAYSLTFTKADPLGIIVSAEYNVTTGLAVNVVAIAITPNYSINFPSSANNDVAVSFGAMPPMGIMTFT